MVDAMVYLMQVGFKPIQALHKFQLNHKLFYSNLHLTSIWQTCLRAAMAAHCHIEVLNTNATSGERRITGWDVRNARTRRFGKPDVQVISIEAGLLHVDEFPVIVPSTCFFVLFQYYASITKFWLSAHYLIAHAGPRGDFIYHSLFG